jgi:hypothetical protein
MEPTGDDLPALLRVRQRFERPRVDDPVAAVRQEMARLCPPGSLPAGARIGVACGSRGIRGIAGITKAAVDWLREQGADPFIIPAMGSHGGGTAEGQTHLIRHFGVTPEAMGCPVRAEMDTRSLGRTADGIDVRLSEVAWHSDGIVLINRIKPHTDYKGPLESGLTKMCAIGLGKRDGAREIHRNLFTAGLGGAIRSVARVQLGTGKVLGGIGILENAYHETARIVGVPPEGLLDVEAGLLEQARRLMGRLPLDEIDVLVCDRMGKNISGTGLDTNVIGRSIHGYTAGVPWCEGMPSVLRIVVLDLTRESDGNAVGMGLAEYVPERFASRVDHRVTSLNSITACAPAGARTPIVLPDDHTAIATAIQTSRLRPEGPRVVHVRDTLELVEVRVSEACRPLLEGRDDVEIMSEPEAMRFDDTGCLVSPFGREAAA